MIRHLLAALVAVAFFTIARNTLAASYSVGPAQAHKSVCLLLADGSITLGPGDTITVDPGTYTDACQVHPSGSSTAPIILRGADGPRPLFDAKGLDLSGSGSVPRAILQFTGASYWTVEHLELVHASNASNNGAAFRVTAGGHDITLNDVSIHDNQDGAMSDGPATWIIEDSEIFHNGAGDGQSHNLYLTGDYVRLQGSYIHDSVGGQNVKLRVHTIELVYNLIANEGNYAIDFEQSANTDAPNANAVMIGNVVVRSPNADNHAQTIVFGNDNPSGTSVRNGSLYAFNNTFVFTQANTGFLHMLNPAPGSKAFLSNNVFHATAPGAKIAFDAAADGLISGSNNWVTTGIATATAFTASSTGTDPGFVSATDFHLRADAAVIDQGASALQYADGSGNMQDGAPKLQFQSPLGAVARAANGALDLGAYEYGTAAPQADAGTTSEAGSEPDGGTTMGPADPGCSCDLASGGRSRGGAFVAIALGCLLLVRKRMTTG